MVDLLNNIVKLLNKLIEILPGIKNQPRWVQTIIYMLFLMAFVGVIIIGYTILVPEPEPPVEFSVDNIRQDQHIGVSSTHLNGKGLPEGGGIIVRVYHIANGVRTPVVQEESNLVRRENGEWRYSRVKFEESGGEHELDIEILANGEVVDFWGPKTVYVGWVSAPEILITADPSLETTPQSDDTIDLSQWVTIHDQGPEGTSPAFAAITAMETAHAWNGTNIALSARYVYEKARELDGINDLDVDGAVLPTVRDVLQQFGVPEESVWPYFPNQPDLPAGMSWENLDELANTNKALLFPLSSFDEIPEHLKRGRPIIVGVIISGDSWSSSEGPRPGEIAPPSPDDRILGGHAIVIVAYDQSDSSIRFANSWGTDWGDKGFGYMSQETMEAVIGSGPIWAVEVLSSD